MKTLEVRCCCDARLLGFAQVPDHEAKRGACIKVKRVATTYIFDGQRMSNVPDIEEFVFVVDEVVKNVTLEDGTPKKIVRLALKSNDYPEEIVAKLPGFRNIRNMTPETFTCASCGNTFDKLTPEAEAIAELNVNFPGFSSLECDIVCDECYAKIMDAKPEIDAELAEELADKAIDRVTTQILDGFAIQVIEDLFIKSFAIQTSLNVVGISTITDELPTKEKKP